jgi:hypothetical protein
MIEEIKSMAISSSDMPRRFRREVSLGTAPALRACKGLKKVLAVRSGGEKKNVFREEIG